MNPLLRLLQPRSVALVGATPRPEGLVSLVRRNLDAVGFRGKVFAVNPRYGEVYGGPCYPSLADLPETPDAVFIGVNAGAAVEVVEEAARLAIPAAVVNASGFADGGAAGQALQERMRGAAGRSGLSLCGPNNMGFINYLDEVALWTGIVPRQAAPGRTALVSQSGSISIALTEHARGLPFSHVITAGNEAVLTAADYLELLVEDERVDTILLFLETIRDVARFSRAAQAAAARAKRIAVLKVGRSEGGRAAVSAHTGALSGEEALYDAYFRHHGIIRVDDLDELVEAGFLLSALPSPPPRRPVLATTVSGGEAALVADVGTAAGLEFAPLPAADVEALKRSLPDFWQPRNPLDVWGFGWDRARFAAMVEVLAGVAGAGLVICFVDAPAAGGTDLPFVLDMAEICLAARTRTDRAFLFVNNTAGPVNAEVAAILDKAGIPYLSGMRAATSVIGCWLRAAATVLTKDAPAPALPSLAGLPESARFAALRAAGLPMSETIAVRSPDEAAEAARRLGFPVAMKGTAGNILHKTEADLIRLGLADEAEVRRAFAMLAASLATAARGATDAEIVLQPMAGAGIELILAARNDTPFGSVLVVGLGGMLVELLKQASLRIGPVDEATARAMLEEIPAGALLRGMRGRGPYDIDAAAAAIAAFSRIAAGMSDAATVEINPLIVLPAGRGARAVDLVIERQQPAGEAHDLSDDRL